MPRDLWLVLAGAVAGIVGTAGGITTLVSYPALIWVGVPPLPASIANTVAVVACWPGAAMTSRTELRGGRPLLRRAAVPTVVGAVLGAVLLVLTPARGFGRIVAPLVLLGSLALVAEPRLRAWQARRGQALPPYVLFAAMFLLGLYNSYFGGGSGILMLLTLLLTAEAELLRANAVKNMLVGVAAVVGAAAFALAVSIRWSAVVPLGAGLFVGSLIGPVVARRLPTDVLRWAVALTGVALAVDLVLNPG